MIAWLLLAGACTRDTTDPMVEPRGPLLAAGPVVCELVGGATACATVGQEHPYTPAKGLPAIMLATLNMSANLVCGLDAGGQIHCDGFDQYGLLDAPEGTWSEVAAGNSHACALDLEGAPSCWGADFDDATVVPAGLRVRNLVVGDNRSCAQDRATGDWTCWGADSTYPVERGVTLGVPPPGTTLSSPSMPGVSLFGIHADGTLGYYRHPDDPLARDQVPTGGGYVRVDGGSRNVCALHESGRIDCWGSNEWGQAEVPEGTWVDVAAGDTMVCGRLSDDTVRCWGCGGECPRESPDIP